MRRLRREKALENAIGRAEGRIRVLEARSRRFFWYRLGVIVAGGLATWLAVARLGAGWGWRTALLFLALLVFVAFLHRRVDAWVEKFMLWQGIQTQQLARLRRDWERIPETPLPPGRPPGSLEIDLDLTGRRSLHQLLDTAISHEGSRLLADWLAQPEPDPDRIRERQRIVQELTPLAAFRNQLLLTFRLAAKKPLEGEKLLRWLAEEIPSGRLRWALPVSIVWVSANLALFIANSFGWLPAFWIVSLALYMVFYLANPFNLFFEAIVQLDRELDKLQTVLCTVEAAPLGDRKALEALLSPLRMAEKRPSARLRKVKWITAGVGMRMNPVAGLVLNLVSPWDFLFAYWAVAARNEVAGLLPAWLSTLYTLEAYISLSNFAYLNPDYAFPDILPSVEPVLQGECLGHPLLSPSQKVCNDIQVDDLGQVVLITGSNMAGKSTFIKTVGINLCLAYAGGPVDATRFRARPFRIHTCIRISDSITDGFSYFYAEVRCLRRLLERLDGEGWPVLYLIDEIFRGTNNRERLIGSRAYLRQLIKENGLGFLATHDLELAGLAETSERVLNYHFRDEVQDGRLVFDYRLRPGPSPTTNALKIMRLEGLPVDEPRETPG